MPLLRKLYRSLLLILLIIIGLVLSLLFLRGSASPGSLSSRITCRWLGSVARALGVRVKIHGRPNHEHTLFVGNHISWLDILVLGSIVPVHFLSKHEVKTMPVIGALATRAGTLYIHRGRHESASKAGEDISRVLRQKHNALVFAEGTTSDGNIRKFHSRMLQAAIDSQAMLQPVAIFYPHRDRQTGEIRVDFNALFIGNTTIGESFNRVARARRIDAEVHYLTPVSAAGKTRAELAQYAFEQVVDCIARIKSGKA
ncbi:MAG TPA: 1-acyl-sn-glycerol-3-phosphate acyltransferase [Gammaproteobacteria bacterium]|nr:1-acyl-sn-glycerol-3-phosphate acyltransferase [Gammaproteobacteria bacterium]